MKPKFTVALNCELSPDALAAFERDPSAPIMLTVTLPIDGGELVKRILKLRETQPIRSTESEYFHWQWACDAIIEMIEYPKEAHDDH